MSRESRRVERLDAIRSVSLEDIVMGRHTRWRRFLKQARRVVLAASLLGLTAAFGSAAYYLASGPDGPSELAAAPADTTPTPAHESTQPEPATRLAAFASKPTNDVQAETEVARVPKPRPDEGPIVTGSIKRDELVIYGRVERRPPAFHPCRMFNDLAFALRIPPRC